MVVLEGKDYIDLRSHNGRCYNVILTFEQRTDDNEKKFYFSVPSFGTSWQKNTAVPDEVLNKYKPSERKRVLKFINKCINT